MYMIRLQALHYNCRYRGRLPLASNCETLPPPALLPANERGLAAYSPKVSTTDLPVSFSMTWTLSIRAVFASAGKNMNP